MVTRRGPGSPGTRTALVVVALAGFGAAAALVGAGSIGVDQRGGSPGSDTAVVAVAILVGALSLGFVVVVALRTRQLPGSSSEPEPVGHGVLLKPLLTPVMATLLLLLAYSLVIGPCLSDKSQRERTVRGKSSSTTTAKSADQSDHTDRPNWTVVTGIVLGVAGVAMALAAAASRRRSSVEPDEPTLGDEIALSLVDLDSLDEDPDHRRVVIRAYARMERALGRTGIPRERSETPQEFLRRALAHLGAGATPASRLTGLFEQARFSTHPVDQAMRADAAAALRTVRDEIAADQAGATSAPGTGP